MLTRLAGLVSQAIGQPQLGGGCPGPTNVYVGQSRGRPRNLTNVQHLLGHASVKITEKAYAAFVKNGRFKQAIDLLYQPVVTSLKLVR